MLPALCSLKNLIKTKSYHIDLPFFRLHYQVTVCLLLAFCLILTAKVLFGDTIDCISRTSGKSDLEDNACYAIGTYSRYREDNATRSGTFRAHPDGKYIYPGLLVNPGGKLEVFWHNYYQYIPVVLFVQAVLFYFPHYLWKIWENGIISSVCKRLHDHRFAPNDYLDSNCELIYYLQNCFKLNKSLVYKYYFCHILLLLNLVIQVIALDAIFNHQFMSYGYVYMKYLLLDRDIYGIRHLNQKSDHAVLSQHIRDMNDPMDFVFPKITNCHVDFMSQAGKSQNEFVYYCVLPLNILHDKFFLLLWFWFLFLGASTVIQIVYDILYMMLPLFRKYMFVRKYGKYFNRSSLPEIFLLNIIGQNTDRLAFTALLSKLHVI